MVGLLVFCISEAACGFHSPHGLFGEGCVRTMALVAKSLISLMARGALFLKETPCSLNRSVSNPSSHPLSGSAPGGFVRSAGRRTLLCMWMVYSRATTSAMAERWALPVGFLDDISAVEVISFGLEE